jgi:3-isopropylmalate/(R)-2-methylmalate dehydratase small subunit
MQPFRVLTGIAVPLDRANIDTDQIIPKQFLKRVERTGYGEFLFNDYRYRANGTPDPAFVLNQPRYAGASIVLAGRNFGCGSSREHAPWALSDYGIRAILAPYFADIFSQNSAKNGILLVPLAEDQIAELMRRTQQTEGYRLTVDLEQCAVRDTAGFCAQFAIDSFQRRCLLEGLDDIGLTLEHEAQITAYEARRATTAW